MADMTAILTYTPMVEAHVAVIRDGVQSAYDLSEDITRFSINLKTDDSSDFTLHLKNESKKYTGLLMPMDKIAIYLSKSEKYQVLAGFITKAPYYNLNTDEIEIRGRDVIYRLQKLYWDASLESSFWLTYRNQDNSSQDGGYWKSGAKVLQAVANWPAEKISVGQIPSDVINWAVSMYQAKLTDTQGADMVNQVYSMLQSSGPTIGTGGSTSGGSGTVGTGEEIIIPNGIGVAGYYTYMAWQMITAPDSAQYKLKQEAGMLFDDNGFGIIKGRYVIACTPKFGGVGDYIDWVMENGSVINSVVGDIKGGDAGNEWGHNQGQNIVEFVVDRTTWYGSSRSVVGYHPDWNSRITKAVKVGGYW